MTDLLAAIDDLELPPALLCERIPTLPPRSDERRHRIFYTPDGVEIEYGEDGWAEAVAATGAYKAQPENQRWSSMVFQGQGIEIATDYIGESAAILGWEFPVIFETMIFSNMEGLNHWCRRYITRAAAFAGHRTIVGMLLIQGAELIDGDQPSWLASKESR